MVVRLPNSREFHTPFSFGKGFLFLWAMYMLFLFVPMRETYGEESLFTLISKANPPRVSALDPTLIWAPQQLQVFFDRFSNSPSKPIVIFPDSDTKVIYAVYSPTELSLDENPQSDFWRTVPEFRFAKHRTPVPSWTSVKVQWDKNFLYVLFNTQDPSVESSIDTWDGDSVSFIIRSRETGTTYKHRFDIQGAGEGLCERKLVLKEGTTLNDVSDQDEGFWILMKIRWSNLRINPFDGAKLPINLISVNHNGKPGARHDESGVEFSKLIWDRGTADTTLRHLILIGDIPSPITAPPETILWEKTKPDYERAEDALLYVLGQQDSSSGLFRSYQGENIAHTYDQALVLADLVSEMEIVSSHTQRYRALQRFAEKLARALTVLQNPDGSWFNAYDATSKKPLTREKYTGVTSWMTYALFRYGNLTSNLMVIESAQRSGQWLKTQMREGALVHEFKSGAKVAITEANMNGWYAFQALGDFKTADQIKDSLMNRVWSKEKGYFFAGWNVETLELDQDPYLDNQVLGAHFLKLIGEPQKASQALRFAKQNFAVLENGKMRGFDGRTSKLAIWLEGTFFYIIAGGPDAQELLHAMNKLQNPRGGYPHDTQDMADPWHTRMVGVNATIWGHQANLGTHLLKIPAHRIAYDRGAKKSSSQNT